MNRISLAVGLCVLLGSALVVLAVTETGPFETDAPRASRKPAPKDLFDSAAAYRLLREQVALGPRPAGSNTSRRLAARLKRLLPHGTYQAVPDGLRNVVGRVPGAGPGFVVVGAHYDSKDLPGFLGANDSASGTAVALQLARTIDPRTLRRTIVFVLFDGEESPRGTPDDRGNFLAKGLRGSRVAARRFRRARAMVLLDFVGDKQLATPREGYSNAELWDRLRAAARRAGALSAFPAATTGGILDDHFPFLKQGVPSIDLIDFDFPCWHRSCDDLSAVSERSLEITGETMVRLLASL